ncbi:fimbrillin family protein [Bacteroides sp.]
MQHRWYLVVEIGLIVCVLLLQGCSYGVEEDCLSQEEAVPIRMAIEEERLPTRAPVTTIDASNLSSVGIYGVREGTTAGQFPWTATPFATNLVPSAISGNQLSFSPVLYYPLGGKRVTFYGYYPRTTATSGANYITVPGAGIAPTYHFTLTGAEDVMYAVSSPSGSSSPAPVALTFNHVLTQLQLNTSLLGSLSGIKLIGVSTKGTLDLGTGNVTYDSSVADISLSVPLLGSVTAPVMVPAGVASYKVEVTLLLSLLKRTYLVKPTSGNFQAGMIYTISL